MEEEMKKKEFRLMVAPLQGLTEAGWRRVHFAAFDGRQGMVEYFTPFIRVEKGEVRSRDLRDFTSELNEGMILTPQIIFRDADEWRLLVDTLVAARATRIDMNMGCPFPPQVKKGRGAGLLSYPDRVAQIADALDDYSDVKFSVKMRLGVDDPGESVALIDILNSMPLRHVTVHPRTAKQQYKGELHLKEMADFSSKLQHPVVFNGDVSTPAAIKAIASEYAGVMVGRGLLRRPSLFAEYATGQEFSEKEQEEAFLNQVKLTASLLSERLCGESQLRDKMKPYWEYAPASMDKKIVKIGKKNGIIVL